MNDKIDPKDLKSTVNFFFETGMLAQTPRSGLHFLGNDRQSVAEHMNRVCYIGLVMAWMDGTVDENKVLKMCLFHDITESRISDLAFVHQKYTERHEEKALADLVEAVPFGKKVEAILHEYEERKTKESLIVKDADTLELMCTLKELVDTGNPRAATWLPSTLKRIKTDIGHQLAEEILTTPSDDWWFFNKEDEYWVTRNKGK